MQNLFSASGPWPTPWMVKVLSVVRRLVERSPSRTVFTRFITPRTAEEMPGRWQAYYRKWETVTRSRIDDEMLGLLPELQEFAPPALVFDKQVYSAFADGRLHILLRRLQVDTIIVTGSETDVCVLASVMAAIDHGYRVVVAADGICSSADETHDALISVYTKRFDVQLEVASADEILDQWRP